MKNLTTALKGKTLEDLQEENVDKGSNLIEPTTAMISSVLTMLKEGKEITEIKKTVKKKGTNLTLSFGQIREIDQARRVKIAELTPKEELNPEE